MSADKVELGRHLFYDKRLSFNGRSSCASCHQQALAFTDGRPRAIGTTGGVHPHNSQTLVNVAYNAVYSWADPTMTTLEVKVAVPLFNTDPVELGISGHVQTLLHTLAADPYYRRAFTAVFIQAAQPISIDNVGRALAAFVRSIIAADSAFDRLLYRDDRTAMSDAAMRGMRLFFSDRLKKYARCHQGQNLGGSELGLGGFHNIGLTEQGGLSDVTAAPGDAGKFRTPSLRNIALTAPYMHDGGLATLDAVIDHYAAGAVSDSSAPGNASDLVAGFTLTSAERQDLLAFLGSLTDQQVLSDPRFQSPWD